MEENWKVSEPDEDGIHKIWRHEEGHEVAVEMHDEDATWDTWLDEKLIANRDDPIEAEVRALELISNGFRHHLE